MLDLPDPATVNALLERYDLGGPVELEAGAQGAPAVIAGGTRYRLQRLDPAGEAGLGLARHLARQGLPVPPPLPACDGALCVHWQGARWALMEWPQGSTPQPPGQAHCAAVGALLGRLHLAGADYPLAAPNPRGPQWRRQTVEALGPGLAAEDRALLEEELRFQGLYRFQDLPTGPIHNRPEPGRLLFTDEQISAVLGLELTCRDALLLDLAVAAEAWCRRPDDGSLDLARVQAMLRAYHARRPLTAIERGAWPVLLRAAALRAWLEGLAAGDARGAAARASALRRRAAEERDLQLAWV